MTSPNLIFPFLVVEKKQKPSSNKITLFFGFYALCLLEVVVQYGYFLMNLKHAAILGIHLDSFHIPLTEIKTRLLVSGRSPECSDCILGSMEQ